MKTPSLTFLSLVVASASHAQIQIVDASSGANQVALSGGTYTQNFDSLTGTPPNKPWFDNATLPGWYGTYQGIGFGYGQGIISFGSADGQGDRAFGPCFRGEATGLRFTNNSTSVITGVNVKFDGEQWASAANRPQIATSLLFSYQIFEADQGDVYQNWDEGWIFVSALDFVSPNTSLSGINYTALDGNAPENSVRGIESFISGLSVQPGQELWLRWTSPALHSGNNHGLGIDNLSVSFTSIPEPASSSTLLALAALAFASRRRRG